MHDNERALCTAGVQKLRVRIGHEFVWEFSSEAVRSIVRCGSFCISVLTLVRLE